jgi:hypothetical protein
MGERRSIPEMDKLISLRIDPTWYELNKDLGFGAFSGSISSKPYVAPTKLSFLSLDLEGGLEEGGAVNYADFDVIGRAEAYKSYTGTGNRTFSLVFKFHAQGLSLTAEREKRWERFDRLAARDRPVNDPEREALIAVLENEVFHPALWLDALKQPWAGSDGISHAPPPCMLTLGRLFEGRVLATDVQITWQPPFDPETLLAHAADVACTFEAVRERIDNYSYGMRR